MIASRWGFTNVGPDVLDLYIEKINPDNPNQYEVNGQWVDMTVVQETIKVAGSSSIDLTVRYTRHGPVVYDNPTDHQKIQDTWGIEPCQQTLPSPCAGPPLSQLISSKLYLALTAAQNWDEYRQAARYFAVPSQNMVYADIDGNIAYQTPGNIPIRLSGHNGDYPVPGWTDEYEWQGYIPFDQLPNAYNPPEGYIVSANNAVVGANYPYHHYSMNGIMVSERSASSRWLRQRLDPLMQPISRKCMVTITMLQQLI